MAEPWRKCVIASQAGGTALSPFHGIGEANTGNNQKNLPRPALEGSNKKAEPRDTTKNFYSPLTPTLSHIGEREWRKRSLALLPCPVEYTLKASVPAPCCVAISKISEGDMSCAEWRGGLCGCALVAG